VGTDAAGADETWRLLGELTAVLRAAAPLDERLRAACALLVPALADAAEVLPALAAPPPAGGAAAVDLPLGGHGGEPLGALRLVRGAARGPLGGAERELAEEAAARIAAAVEVDHLRARVEELARNQDELLATLSHELRTPLNVVVGWVDLLRRDQLPQEKHARALELIDRNARVQSRLMDDLLDASRMLAGRVRVEPRPLTSGELVLEAVEALRPQAAEAGVALEVRIEAQPTVQADPERLSQVLHNLIGNAVKFTPSGGRVEVSLTAQGGHALIQVADTGAGIAPELLPRVFDRFVQGERRRLGKTRGLGLGLYIARHLVRLHGGDIEVASEGPGRGARFTVRLPT